MGTQVAKRPVSVTSVVGLTWLISLVTIANGLFLMFGEQTRLESLGINTDRAVTVGLVYMVLGMVMGVFASALGKGSQFARVLVSALLLLRFLLGVIAVGVLWGSGNQWAAMVTPLLALLILYLLWNAKASAWFAAR